MVGSQAICRCQRRKQRAGGVESSRAGGRACEPLDDEIAHHSDRIPPSGFCASLGFVETAVGFVGAGPLPGQAPTALSLELGTGRPTYAVENKTALHKNGDE